MNAKTIFTDEWRFGSIDSSTGRELLPKMDCSAMVGLGSCFARNIRRWMHHHNLIRDEDATETIFNIQTILYEIRRLTEELGDYDPLVIDESGEHGPRFRDPWRTWLTAPTREELAVKNNTSSALRRRAFEQASSVFITLGLAEVWHLRSDVNAVLNRVPVEAIKAGKSEWTSRFSTVEEIRTALSGIVYAVREQLGLTVPIVFTLSPVPLKYTSSLLPIREANNLSKAVQVAALHSELPNHANTRYFRSYEMVQALAENGPEGVWQADGRHVSATVVDTVSREFLRTNSIHELPARDTGFWVPHVNKQGKIDGKLFLDGTVVLS